MPPDDLSGFQGPLYGYGISAGSGSVITRDRGSPKHSRRISECLRNDETNKCLFSWCIKMSLLSWCRSIEHTYLKQIELYSDLFQICALY